MMKKEQHEGPLKIPMKFDDVLKLAVKVKPPAEGWVAYEAKLKQERGKRRKPKSK